MKSHSEAECKCLLILLSLHDKKKKTVDLFVFYTVLEDCKGFQWWKVFLDLLFTFKDISIKLHSTYQKYPLCRMPE